MGLSFFRDTVTVIRAQLAVKNGSEYRDWEHATQTQISRVQVTARSTSRDGPRASTTDGLSGPITTQTSRRVTGSSTTGTSTK